MADRLSWESLELDTATGFEEVVVKHILAPFAELTVDHAAPVAGSAVVDLGCGSGAASRLCAERVGTSGSVYAIDINPSQIEVARRLPEPPGCRITWEVGDASQIRLDDDSVDLVIGAQVLQFLPDPVKALIEAQRILKPGGKIVHAIWAAPDDNPYIKALVEGLSQFIGDEAGEAIATVFRLSNEDALRAVYSDAGLDRLDLEKVSSRLKLPPAQTFVQRHLRAMPLQGVLTEAGIDAVDRCVSYVCRTMHPYENNGGFSSPFTSWIASTVPSVVSRIPPE